jgi:hypothetical protein
LGYICGKEGLSPNHEDTCLICDPLKLWINQGVLCMGVILNSTPNKASFQISLLSEPYNLPLLVPLRTTTLITKQTLARRDHIQHLEAWVSCMVTKLIKVTLAKEYCYFLEYISSTTDFVGETTSRHYAQPLHSGSVDQERGYYFLFGESIMAFLFIT